MDIHHDRRGTGEPLVLIHGIGHRWQAWEPVLDRLAEHHEVIAIDLPGFGRSPAPPRGTPRDMPHTVAVLAEFIASSGLGTPHVAGNSLGGGIALELASAGLVRSATALAPAGFFSQADRLRALAILSALRAGTFLPAPVIYRAMRVGAVRAAMLAPIVARPRLLDPERAAGDALALRSRSFHPVAWAGRTYQFTGAPAVPVTVAWGSRDRILPPRQARLARVRLPRARHETLVGCGHVPMSDAPDRVAELILQTTGALSRPVQQPGQRAGSSAD
ncbi:MAG TPA: alpha/beta fold hydrolase [Rugosimonospora sp.]|nr:alpha/beta fold hydrolase [Rugosimonospora sp.]